MRLSRVAFPLGASLFGLGKLYRDYEADEPSGGRRVSQRLFLRARLGTTIFC